MPDGEVVTLQPHRAAMSYQISCWTTKSVMNTLKKFEGKNTCMQLMALVLQQSKPGEKLHSSYFYAMHHYQEISLPSKLNHIMLKIHMLTLQGLHFLHTKLYRIQWYWVQWTFPESVEVQCGMTHTTHWDSLVSVESAQLHQSNIWISFTNTCTHISLILCI